MDLRQITDSYSVAPQLAPTDMAALADAGFTTVICNRPDGENPGPLQAAAMQAAAEAAGLHFVFNPVIGGQMTMDNVEEQRDAIDAADGPVIAYCASGNRSSAGLSVLARRGYRDLYQVEGGIDAWRDAGYEIEL